MATTKTWYIAAATGAKVDFTDPSADIDFSGDVPVAKRELRIVKTEEGGTDDHPTVVLWKAEDQEITEDEITAAIADQDDAAVPTLQQAPDDPSGTRDAAITAVAAPAAMTATAIAAADATDDASAQALANELKADYTALREDVTAIRNAVVALVTAVNALITSGENQGELDPN